MTITPIDIDIKPSNAAQCLFEVVVGNPASPKHVYRIWADGRTEGFEHGSEALTIFNRIPLALREARASRA